MAEFKFAKFRDAVLLGRRMEMSVTSEKHLIIGPPDLRVLRIDARDGTYTARLVPGANIMFADMIDDSDEPAKGGKK